MRFYIIIPAYNEESYIAQTLKSLVSQTYLPELILVVNDNSTDQTQEIVDRFSMDFPFVRSISITSENVHSPGSKIINAFNRGLNSLDDDFDIVCKFDADLIFPNTYLENLKRIYESNDSIGIAGGFCYIQNNGHWILEDLTNKDHVRGALKSYRKYCFNDIGGLKSSMGWDTIDELLARYKGWEIFTENDLRVRHLKPTGKVYTKKAKLKQGEAFYKMRYGFILTLIASLKLSFKKGSGSFFFQTMRGYLKSKKDGTPFIVNQEEGVFIRKYRWNNIRKRIF
jgi:glycosyltransferase involved in cell wall biosynthesis